MTNAGQGDARRLASGSLMQQISQVTGLLVMFAIVTVLARRLTLAELGVYGLLGSIAGYLLIVQNAAAGAAVRNIAAGAHGPAAATAYSTASAAYVGRGPGHRRRRGAGGRRAGRGARPDGRGRAPGAPRRRCPRRRHGASAGRSRSTATRCAPTACSSARRGSRSARWASTRRSSSAWRLRTRRYGC